MDNEDFLHIEQTYLRETKPGVERASPPLWVGKVFVDTEYPVVMPGTGNHMEEGILISRIQNLPKKELVERTIEAHPAAEPMLRKWQEIWESSFPGWEEDEKWLALETEQTNREWCEQKIVERIKSESKKGTVPSAARLYGHLEHIMRFAKDCPRSRLLHVIDDAMTVTRTCENEPFGSIIYFGEMRLFAFVGHNQEGVPVVEQFSVAEFGRTSAVNGAFVKKRMNDHPAYWTWPFFNEFSKRRSVLTDSAIETAMVLMDMRAQGHKKAFLKNQAAKHGTWTVDLETATDMTSTRNLLASVLWEDAKGKMIVQEHLPFTHEQRFYIVDGMVVGSTCSDRHFSVIDKRPGRRLDDRIAVLTIPEIDQGVFDRGITTHVVDRNLSAQFARKAREIARAFKAQGITEYCLDLGLTERGVTAVEINTLHFAGPYSFDRQWIIDAYRRKALKAGDKLRSQLVEMVDTIKLSQAVRKKTLAFIDDLLPTKNVLPHQSVLQEILAEQKARLHRLHNPRPMDAPTTPLLAAPTPQVEKKHVADVNWSFEDMSFEVARKMAEWSLTEALSGSDEESMVA